MTLPAIRRASPADAEQLAAFAEHMFLVTFGADNRPEDLALFLPSAFGVAHQAREIADPQMLNLVAEHDGALVAYAQLRLNTPHECVADVAPTEVWRFYVSTEWHGRGLAQRLMERVFQEARDAGAATIWLGVWERNPRGIAFYKKMGYIDVGSHVFMVGTDPQTDRVLSRALGATS